MYLCRFRNLTLNLTLTQTLTLSLARTLTLCLFVSEKNDPSDKWTVTDLWCCTQFLSATLVFVLRHRPRPLRGLSIFQTSSISVPNFKRTALFVQRESQNFEIGSPDPGHADLGVILWTTHRRGPSSISVPNLKRIAQFVHTLLRGTQNLEIRSCDPGHAHLGVVRMQSIPNLKWLALFVQKLLGVPTFQNSVTWPRPRPFRGHFMVHTLEGCVLNVWTKFEAEKLFLQKLIGVPKFGNWVTWSRPRPLKGRFMIHTHDPYISVPNLKRIAQFVHKLLRGSQNLEIRSRDPATPI